jgi:phosphohistidine phosphatase
MERRLIVLRHAKSDWDTDAPTDHERPLNKRGRHDAPRVGRRLAKLGWEPQLVLASDAARARETWLRMSDAFEDAIEVRYLPSFYLGGYDAVRTALEDVPAALSTLMVVGHNPGWEVMVGHLIGEAVELTTANAALLTVEAPGWPAAIAQAGHWELRRTVRPKQL